MSSILEEAKFGLYELFANIIPGTTLLLFLLYIGFYINMISFNDVNKIINFPSTLLIIIFLIISFIFGQVLQAWGSIVAYLIYTIKYQGYPSSRYFLKDDRSFPEHFKEKIINDMIEKKYVAKEFEPQHIFDLCYIYVVQNNISKRVIRFLHMYEFSKNMMGASIVITTIMIVMTIQKHTIYYIIFTLLMVIVTILFYYNFIKYGNSFSKEVLRSYYIHMSLNK